MSARVSFPFIRAKLTPFFPRLPFPCSLPLEEHFSSGLPYNPDPYSPHPYYLGPTPRPKLPLQRDLLPLVDDRQHEPDALHQLMGKRYHEPSPPALSAVEVRHEVLVAIPEEPVQPDYSHADASDLEGEKAEGAGEAGIILRSAPDLNEEEWAQLFALCQAEGEADCEWMVVTGEDEHVEDVAEDDETDEEDDEDDDEDDEDEDDDDEDDDDDDDDEEE